MKNYLKIAFILTSVLFTSMASGQQVNVSGIITEAANGEELPGVSVVVKGTTLGTVSDINGSYSIMASTDDLLVFSFIGYEIMEAPVPSSGRLDITLESTIFNMEEVVVIGYGTMKKSDLTGAVSSVTSGDLTAAPVSGIGEALQGRASGLQVINAGKPGDNVTMKIRGLGTINDSDPLVVID
ncbi:MAG TPA: TonB-dependent receptor plug domain-containing protein, partial [Bacteroidales bacterium]|nr:TonB-dependent receptor plug domain-containing protein [Bacteroidales bacterium]